MRCARRCLCRCIRWPSGWHRIGSSLPTRRCRRFQFCRALAEALTTDADALITKARTERQQRNRAFAAEFSDVAQRCFVYQAVKMCAGRRESLRGCLAVCEVAAVALVVVGEAAGAAGGGDCHGAQLPCVAVRRFRFLSVWWLFEERVRQHVGVGAVGCVQVGDGGCHDLVGGEDAVGVVDAQAGIRAASGSGQAVMPALQYSHNQYDLPQWRIPRWVRRAPVASAVQGRCASDVKAEPDRCAALATAVVSGHGAVARRGKDHAALASALSGSVTATFTGSALSFGKAAMGQCGARRPIQ